MSEDADGDAPASPDPSAPEAETPPPVADPAEPRPSRGRLRLATLGAVAVIGLVVLIVVNRGPRNAVESTGSAGSDAGSVTQAPQRPTLPKDPAHGVRLTGFVVDGTNTPVVGAEVTAELERGAIDRAPAGSGSAAGSGAGSGSAAPTPALTTATPTGSDGRFVLDPPVAGRYRIRVTGPGLLPAEVRYVPVPSDEARIVVARKVTIEGVVLDGKTPAAGATVGLRGDAIGGGIETKADAKGIFAFHDLPEGRYQLYAYRESLAARAMRVNRLGGGPFPPLEVALEAAAIVTGRVIDRDDGQGLAAAIELRPSGDDQAPRYTRSAPDGRFQLEGIPHGKWIADAFSPGYTSPGGVEVDAGHAVPELALARGAVIEGRVLDREGKPLANATVRALGGSGATGNQVAPPQESSAAVDQDRLRRFSGRIVAPTPIVGLASTADPELLPRGELGVMVGPIPPIPPPGAQIARPTSIDAAIVGALVGDPAPLVIDPARAAIWTTGSDGKFRITGLPRGKQVVLAVAPNFAEGRSKQVAVEPPQVLAGVDVTLGPGTFVIGRVSDQHGVKIAGAQLHATPELGAPVDSFTDEDGMYRLGPVTGTVGVVASAYGHADSRRSLEITISTGRKPDERKEDFVLVVADAVLSGTLDDSSGAPVPAAQIEILGGAGGGRMAVVGADGTFSIDMLPAGPLRVRVTHPSYPPAELDARASVGDREKVRLRLPLGGAVEGVLLDASTGLAVTGIINGYGPGGATADASSDARGAWTLGPLRPGHWKLTVEQPGYLVASREVAVSASRAPGATSVHDVRFDLAKGALLGGTARDSRGKRIQGATVAIQSARGDGPTATGSTDSQGEFRIRDAPTGEVAITATSGDLRGSTTVTVRPGDEILGLFVELR